jgi:LysM repeat protein
MLVVLWSLSKLPVEQASQEIIGIKAKVAGLVQVLGPAPTVAQAATTPQLSARATTMTPPAPTVDQGQPETTPAVEPIADVEGAPSPAPTGAGLAAPVETPEPGPQTTGDMPTPASATALPATPTSSPSPTSTPVPPTATALPPTATATLAAGGNANRYRIQSGDTLSSIAQRFNVSLEALLAANRLSASATLRVGQELVIPGGAPTATPKPRATPTPTALPPTPAPNLAAPILASPGDQASYRESNQIALIWEAVPGMVAGNQYLVCIRWMQEGTPQENCPPPTTAISIQVPPYLWGQADQPERRYQWFVKVVHSTTDGQGGESFIPLSPASEMRTFYWN